MSEEPVDTLSRSIMQIFSNTRAENFDYINQRNHYTKQSTLYSSKQKTFYCMCITSPITATPAMAGYVGGTKSLSEDVSAIEKRTVKITFVGRDVFKNGALPDLSQIPDEIPTYLPLAHEATIINEYLNPDIGSIMSVREEANEFIVEQIITNEVEAYDFSKPRKGAKKVYGGKKSKKPLSTYQMFPCIKKSFDKGEPFCYKGKDSPIKDFRDKRIKTKYIVDFDDYAVLAGAFMPLLDYIASYESGRSGFEAHNLGVAGKTTDLKKVLGKGLQEMTISELQRNMKGYDTDGDKYGILFATGRYQIIPRTLLGAVESLKTKGLNPDTTLYSSTTQHKLGAYLLATKRPKIGRYLLLGEPDVKTAGNSLALEWAAFPFLKPATYKPKGKSPFTVPRGASPYDGIAGNKTKPNRAVGLEATLKGTRENVKNILQKDTSGVLKKIIEKYKESGK